MDPIPTLTAQVGDEIQLAVQFFDPATGNILDLTGATGLVIKLEYPDQSTQDFTASFLTDGSDGIIVYNTGASDLSQVGYYFPQGKATKSGKTFSTRNNHLDNVLYVYGNVDNT